MIPFLVECVTPLHVGEGQSASSVDLPVTRERQTGWPFVPGSAVKGALRNRARFLGAREEELLRAFGSEPQVTPLRMGALRFRELSLLALPARSLHGGFALLSTPLALGRLARELDAPPPLPPEPSPDTLLVAPGATGLLGVSLAGATPAARGKAASTAPSGLAVIEELDLLLAESEQVGAWADFLAGVLDPSRGAAALLRHLAVVHADLFAHAARAWLPVRTRAAIDADTGVVKDGALFTVELLPPGSLLWSTVSAEGARLEDFAHLLPLAAGETWTLGGLQSTGHGLLATYPLEQNGRNA